MGIFRSDMVVIVVVVRTSKLTIVCRGLIWGMQGRAHQ